MLRALIYGLTILHLGPGFAFVVVAFGCDSALPLFASICGQDTFAAFIRLTLWAWLVMIVVLLLALTLQRWLMRR